MTQSAAAPVADASDIVAKVLRRCGVANQKRTTLELILIAGCVQRMKRHAAKNEAACRSYAEVSERHEERERDAASTFVDGWIDRQREIHI